jgi:hypothetical protein
MRIQIAIRFDRPARQASGFRIVGLARPEFSVSRTLKAFNHKAHRFGCPVFRAILALLQRAEGGLSRGNRKYDVCCAPSIKRVGHSIHVFLPCQGQWKPALGKLVFERRQG